MSILIEDMELGGGSQGELGSKPEDQVNLDKPEDQGNLDKPEDQGKLYPTKEKGKEQLQPEKNTATATIKGNQETRVQPNTPPSTQPTPNPKDQSATPNAQPATKDQSATPNAQPATKDQPDTPKDQSATKDQPDTPNAQPPTPNAQPRPKGDTQQRRRGAPPPKGSTPCYRRVRQIPNPEKLVPLLGKNSYRMYYCTSKELSSCSPESTIARPIRERCVFIDERGTQSDILPRKIWYDPTAPIEVTDNTVIEGVTWKLSSMFKGFKGFKGFTGRRKPRKDKTITITTADQPTLVTESKEGVELSQRIRPQKFTFGQTDLDLLDTDPFESDSSYSGEPCVIS